MVTAPRESTGPLGHALETRAGRFGFLQVVRLLSRLQRDKEPHFVTGTALRFGPAPVIRVEDLHSPDDHPVITTDFLGLLGHSGALPRHYSEFALKREDMSDHAFGAFLDILSGHLLKLYFASWERGALLIREERGDVAGARLIQGALAGERSLRAPGQTDTSRDHREDHSGTVRLPDIADPGTNAPEAMGDTDPIASSLLQTWPVPDHAPLFFAGLLSLAPRSARGLEQILASLMGCPVTLNEFQMRWLPVPRSAQVRLVGSPHAKGRRALREGVITGSSVRDIQTSLVIRIGPLPLAEYEALAVASETTEPMARLTRLVRAYLRPGLDVRFQFVIKAGQLQPQSLGAGDGCLRPVLGRSAWLRRRPNAQDCDDPIVKPAFSRNESVVGGL